MGCKHCKKEIEQTPGKRKKEFCDNTCRSNYWYDKNKKGKQAATATPKAKQKKVSITEKKEESKNVAPVRQPYMSEAIRKKLGL